MSLALPLLYKLEKDSLFSKEESLFVSKFYQSSWALSPISLVIFFLLTFMPADRSNSLHAAITEENKEASQPPEELLPLIKEVADYLPLHLREEWRLAASIVRKSDRFGPILLEWFKQTEPRLADLLVTDSETALRSGNAVPSWLIDENSTYRSIAPSLRLAIAENYFFNEQYDACLNWCQSIRQQPTYSQQLLDYLMIVSAYMMVDYEQAKGSLASLSGNHKNLGISRRQTIETIMRSLSIKEPGKLKVVAHRMEDVERRLALMQGNQLTQNQQQRIIDDLDELIKKMEEQQKQQQQASNSSSTPSGTPAEESRAGEYKGPGQVDRKRFSSGDPWGALSPAERERLSQGIDRDFPGHYRSLIEGYYKRLADSNREINDQQEKINSKQGSGR